MFANMPNYPAFTVSLLPWNNSSTTTNDNKFHSRSHQQGSGREKLWQPGNTMERHEYINDTFSFITTSVVLVCIQS